MSTRIEHSAWGKGMRNKIVVSAVGVMALLISLPASAQQPPPLVKGKQPGAERPAPTAGPGWKPCPKCQNPGQIEAARQEHKVAGRPFNPRDLSGVWGNGGIPLDLKTLPPMTPEGLKRWEATQAEQLDPNVPAENGAPGSKDGTMHCDPPGYPRALTSSYGFEFVAAADRVIQFFQRPDHVRTIWTDGRQLPVNPPQPTWFGYNVGRWDGDVFVVEATGFDERPWIDEDIRSHQRCFPRSDQMRLVERWRRTAYGTLEVEMTIIDPVIFTKPWVSRGKVDLFPGTELWENLCIPSDYEFHNTELTAGKHSGTAPK